MNSCELCNRIQKLEEQGKFKGFCHYWNIDGIVFNESDNTFHIWSGGSGNPDYADICIANITYCPKCGRFLKETYQA